VCDSKYFICFLIILEQLLYFLLHPTFSFSHASSVLRYDLVDLTRQALAKHANQLFLNVIEAYQLNDVHGVASHSQKFLDLVEDMDKLLACHDGFLLGPWLESAKKLAHGEEQEQQV
jgi:alpha-N-acetylglucosaminidase